MRSDSISTRLATAFATFWRSYVVDECADEKMERIRRERLSNLEVDIAMIEAMRRWLAENEKASGSDKAPQAKLLADG